MSDDVSRGSGVVGDHCHHEVVFRARSGLPLGFIWWVGEVEGMDGGS